MSPTDGQLAAVASASYSECTIKASGVELLFQRHADYAIVASRGTTFDGFDIIMDMRGLPWWSNEFKAFGHRGFLIDIKNIWPHFRPLAVGLDVPLHYTGHSKGGANASYLAAMAVRDAQVPSPASLTTFGCPPIGKGLKRLLRHVPGQRYRYGRDIVPCLGLGIGHPRPVNRIGEKGGPLTDHRIKNYTAALSALS